MRSAALRFVVIFVVTVASGRTANCVAQTAVHPATAGPAVWAYPPNVDNGTPWRELFDHPEGWTQARSRIVGLGYSDHGLGTFSDADLRVWFAQMKQWNLRLSLEVGAIKEWGPTGAEAFAKSNKRWDRFLADGAPFDTIAMDEPLANTLHMQHKPLSYAVEETANYIALVRKKYPTMKVGDIEPYPGIPADQTIEFLDALQARLKQMNVRGLDFFRLDVDWMNFVTKTEAGKDGWRGVAKIEQQVQKRDLPFSLIYWSAEYPAMKNKGVATDITWLDGVVREGDGYLKTGAQPDEYVIESWVGAPHHSVPEATADTFMHSVDVVWSHYVVAGGQK